MDNMSKTQPGFCIPLLAKEEVLIAFEYWSVAKTFNKIGKAS